LRAPAEGGEAQEILDSLNEGFNYEIVPDGIHFITKPPPDSGYPIQFLNTTTGNIQRIATSDKPVGGAALVFPRTADGSCTRKLTKAAAT
jgi:hypothetical protein